MIPQSDRSKLRAMLVAHGWEENIELTAQTDGRRLSFRLAHEKLTLDVSVDVLQFAQTLDVRKAIGLQRTTLPAADLLLSKLQIAELTTSDIIDITALFSSLEVRESVDEGINVQRIVEVTAKSWGWFRSVTSLLDMINATA